MHALGTEDTRTLETGDAYVPKMHAPLGLRTYTARVGGWEAEKLVWAAGEGARSWCGVGICGRGAAGAGAMPCCGDVGGDDAVRKERRGLGKLSAGPPASQNHSQDLWQGQYAAGHCRSPAAPPRAGWKHPGQAPARGWAAGKAGRRLQTPIKTTNPDASAVGEAVLAVPAWLSRQGSRAGAWSQLPAAQGRCSWILHFSSRVHSSSETRSQGCLPCQQTRRG